MVSLRSLWQAANMQVSPSRWPVAAPLRPVCDARPAPQQAAPARERRRD